MHIERWLSPLFLVLFATACGDEISATTGPGGGGTGGSGATSGSGATGGSGGTGATSTTGGTGGIAPTGGGGSGGTGAAGGTGGSGGGTSCTWAATDPCGSGHYCNAPGCGAGTCMPVGGEEQQLRAPACGCDGVTYWNNTVAASHGMAISGGGECPAGVQAQCGGFGGLMCPDGATCNNHVLDKSACNIADLGGTCWAVPKTCEGGVGFGPNTRACGSQSCTDECNLIKLQTPWYVDNTCPQ